ncbi:MAG: glycosyltransferase family 2 protein [Acholeplasmataceae bacterium]|jgi:glycosyltransferase involved in cell wall biosynthesis|nr:glycosyltransferase family 2 protein [Acholeplasmataceae bacterium]
MPVYNGEKFLGEAIESILNQSFKDFELLLINDGSTDHSIEIIRTYMQADSRMQLIVNSQNLGIAESTNVGIAHANGEYIALMDQDDISMQDRLIKEVTFLDNHREVSVVGGNTFILEGQKNVHERQPLLVSPVLIRWALLFRNQLRNPTVMMRREIFTKHQASYENFSPLQDYRFWLKINMKCWFANIPDNLVVYRIHKDNASNLLSDNYLQILDQTRNEFVKEVIGGSLSNVYGITNPEAIKNTSEAKAVCKVLIDWQKLSNSWKPSNSEKNYITEKTIRKIRDICHFQKYHLTLLPEMLYTIWLETKSAAQC